MGRARRDEGMTLVELLLTMAITVIIMSVVTTAFIVTLKSTRETRTTLSESHDAQLVSAYLPSDLLSVGGAATDLVTTASAATGCAGSPTDNYNVARLSWSEAGGSTFFIADYRVRLAGTEWQLVRHACQAPSAAGLASAAATTLVVAHSLKAVSASSDLPTVTVSGSQVTMTVTDLSGYQYAITGTRRTPIAGSTASATPSPTVSAAPERAFVSAVELYNTDANGLVKVVATFSKALDAGCADRFSLSGNGTRGSFSGTATVSGSTATLFLTAPTAPDTTTTGLVVQLAGETTACTAGSFTNTAVTDKAAPVITGISTQVSGTTPGRVQKDDRLAITFSEPLAAVPTLTSVTEKGNNNANTNDLLVLSSLFNGTADLGAKDYVAGNGDVALTAAASLSGSSVIVTVNQEFACPAQGNCNTTPTAGSAATLTYRQADGLADSAGNALSSTATTTAPATVTRTLSGFRAF